MAVWVIPTFLGTAVVSLAASSVLVRALERLGAFLGVAEVLLGLVVALAADGPELTSAITALLRHERVVGVGVLFGSNVFNIAALLGLGSIAARGRGGVRLHRSVVAWEGIAALAVTGAGLALLTGGLSRGIAAGISLAVFLPYVAVAAVPFERLPLPVASQGWLGRVLRDERAEIAEAVDVSRPGSPWSAGAVAVTAVTAVIVASTFMERSAVSWGSYLGIRQVVTGAVVLGAVTSLPNAVAAVYLARGGKGPAVLSEAMNSNTINIVGGLMLPCLLGNLAVGGTGNGVGRGGLFTAGSYAGMAVLALGLAYSGQGLSRKAGWVLVAAYGAFLAGLIAIT